MTDWAGGIKAHNYGISRVTDLRNLTDLLRIILPVAILA